jgi:hypothetical protein
MRAHEACFVRSHLSPANAAMAPPMGSGKPPRNGLETPETPGTNTLPPWKPSAMVLPGALIQCPGWRRSAAHPASPPEHPSRHLRGYPTAKDPKNPRRRSMRQRSEGQGSEGPGAEAQGSESQGSEGQGAEGQGSEGQRSEDQRRAWGSGSPPASTAPGPPADPRIPKAHRRIASVPSRCCPFASPLWATSASPQTTCVSWRMGDASAAGLPPGARGVPYPGPLVAPAPRGRRVRIGRATGDLPSTQRVPWSCSSVLWHSRAIATPAPRCLPACRDAMGDRMDYPKESR